jgi:cobalt/nickel transport protein
MIVPSAVAVVSCLIVWFPAAPVVSIGDDDSPLRAPTVGWSGEGQPHLSPLPLGEGQGVRAVDEICRISWNARSGNALTLALSQRERGPANETRWEGVDKTVIEKFAADAGHAAREPYINTEQGDLLLFLFLVAGAASGFVAGYAFRTLFPPRSKNPDAGQTLYYPGNEVAQSTRHAPRDETPSRGA